MKEGLCPSIYSSTDTENRTWGGHGVGPANRRTGPTRRASVYQPPLGHPGFQEGQAQPLHELHPEFPEQGVAAVGEPTAVQALEHGGSCERQHTLRLVAGFRAPTPQGAAHVFSVYSINTTDTPPAPKAAMPKCTEPPAPFRGEPSVLHRSHQAQRGCSLPHSSLRSSRPRLGGGAAPEGGGRDLPKREQLTPQTHWLWVCLLLPCRGAQPQAGGRQRRQQQGRGCPPGGSPQAGKRCRATRGGQVGIGGAGPEWEGTSPERPGERAGFRD